jgi:hypothetical protein
VAARAGALGLTVWPRRAAATLGIVGGVATAVLALAGATPRNIDDAFIVLVYARHLLQDGQLYWNLGDGHVDGYTSTLDLLVKTLALAVAPGDPLRNADVLGVVFLVASVVAGGLLALRAADGGGRATLAVAVLASVAFGANIALAQGTSYLLETSLYVFTALGSVGLLVVVRPESARARWSLAAAWLLLSLARPEGALLAVVQIGFFLARARDVPRMVRVQPCVAFLALFGVYLAWHLAYFGYLAPNTFYAKASDSRWSEIADGLAYVLGFARSPARAGILTVTVLAPALALVKGAWRTRQGKLAFLAVSSCAFVSLGEVIVEGGDSYDDGRFMAATVALTIASLAVAVGALAPRFLVLIAVPLAMFVLTEGARIASHTGERVNRIRTWPMRMADFDCEIEATRIIADRVDVIAETDLQRSKAFFDRLRVIDLVALNDQPRAHSPEPGRNVWGKGGVNAGPATGAEILELGPLAWNRTPVGAFSVRQIADDESASFLRTRLEPGARAELIANYRPMSIPTCGTFLNVFVRNDRANRFAVVKGVLQGATGEEP